MLGKRYEGKTPMVYRLMTPVTELYVRLEPLFKGFQMVHLTKAFLLLPFKYTGPMPLLSAQELT